MQQESRRCARHFKECLSAFAQSRWDRKGNRWEIWVQSSSYWGSRACRFYTLLSQQIPRMQRCKEKVYRGRRSKKDQDSRHESWVKNQHHRGKSYSVNHALARCGCWVECEDVWDRLIAGWINGFTLRPSSVSSSIYRFLVGLARSRR